IPIGDMPHASTANAPSTRAAISVARACSWRAVPVRAVGSLTATGGTNFGRPTNLTVAGRLTPTRNASHARTATSRLTWLVGAVEVTQPGCIVSRERCLIRVVDRIHGRIGELGMRRAIGGTIRSTQFARMEQPEHMAGFMNQHALRVAVPVVGAPENPFVIDGV